MNGLQGFLAHENINFDVSFRFSFPRTYRRSTGSSCEKTCSRTRLGLHDDGSIQYAGSPGGMIGLSVTGSNGIVGPGSPVS